MLDCYHIAFTINPYLKLNKNNIYIYLIHKSSHGSNFASASIEEYTIIKAENDKNGNISINYLIKSWKIWKKNFSYDKNLSTSNGVYKNTIRECIDIVHKYWW